MSEPKWLVIARSKEGIKEIPGKGAHPDIIAFHATTTLKATSDEVHWCSSFVNWVMLHAGFEPTRSAAAISWKNWGMTVKPQIGAIAVFPHHVGFVVGFQGEYVLIFGGNQSNAVNTKPYPKKGVLSYRMPKGYLTEEEIEKAKEYVPLFASIAAQFDFDDELDDILSDELGPNYFAYVLMGMCSRESRFGLALSNGRPDGSGDNGHGRGIMQIDDRSHQDFIATGKWVDPQESIEYAADLFLDYYNRVSEYPQIESLEDGFWATVASYNCGPGNVAKGLRQVLGWDYFTTGRDYSEDVQARAKYLYSLRLIDDADVEKREAKPPKPHCPTCTCFSCGDSCKPGAVGGDDNDPGNIGILTGIIDFAPGP